MTKMTSEAPLRHTGLDGTTVLRMMEGQARSGLLVACPAWDGAALREAVRERLPEGETELLARLLQDVDLSGLT